MGKGIEEELETVGDNMKQLEKSAEKVQDHRGQVRVRRDEHHQAQPEDRRHRGRDLPREAKDQEVFRRARRHIRRHDLQLLKYRLYQKLSPYLCLPMIMLWNLKGPV